jgi:hypothetical protein
MGNAEKEVKEHDYFGVPADMNCQIKQYGDKPIVLLDSMILPTPSLDMGSKS